jgi:ribonuclease BN (tRNA processing enzyme)
VKLTVLGCSGSMPGPESAASGYLIEQDGFRLVLDLGHGTFGVLQRHLDPADVDAIVVSHLHADHCLDLTAYIVALRYGPAGYGVHRPEDRIRVIGPSGTRGRLEAAYDPYARKLGLTELFNFSTPRAGELGPFQVSYAETNHPVPTNAVRLTAGDRTLAYSADTGVSADVVSLAKDADVFLCEASFGADETYIPDLHLTAAQAGEHADQAGVGRLVVTHVPPWLSPERAAEEAAAVFPGPVEAARPGSEITI